MLEPATPKADDFGRLSASSALGVGWACRWCNRPLRFVLNHQAGTASGLLGCTNCDHPEGITP